MTTKKNIALLGSTGSIGTQALDVIRSHKELFNVVALIANNNSKLLIKQAKEFMPKYVGIYNSEKYEEVRSSLDKSITVECGEEILINSCTGEIDIALISVVGMIGIKSLLTCIDRNIQVALANKEALVCGGSLVTDALKKKNMIVYPVDSEHSAIFQCLQNKQDYEIDKLLITASGGAFRDWKKEDLIKATLKDALKHPNWNMGAKVTIDSASMMNKGLEVIEASRLFNVPAEKIDVLIHPQSIVHSLVQFKDSSVLAQLGNPDMKLPIQYALTYPDRINCDVKTLDLAQISTLSFSKPDLDKYKCLSFAYDALKAGDSYCIALNAANEVAVDLLVKEKIRFIDIPILIEKALEKQYEKVFSLEDIMNLDYCVREYIYNKYIDFIS